MKRNFLKLLLSVALMMCCTVMTWALETPPNDEIWYTSSDAKEVEPNYKKVYGANILSNTYNGSKGVIKFDGPVTIIGNYAFDGCTTLLSLSMPNSVTSIGNRAFSRCSSLKEIKISKSVASIGQYAFSECTGLTSIVVDEGNEIYDSRDNCNAIIETATNTLIKGCQNTTIPNTVEKIGDDAFSGCTNLTSINIPTSVTSIGHYAFNKCSSLLEITIPNSVKSIGQSAFQECSSLKEITIPNSVTSIGQYAFVACAGLTSVSVTSGSIGGNAFNGCTNLSTVTLGGGVTSIGQFAFEKCSNLSMIEIPNSVTSIGQYAFSECTGLTSVSVTSGSIGNDAFADCTNLSTVILQDETTGNGVTSIEGSAFRQCDNLKSIKIPGTVKSMGQSVFLNTNLDDVTIEDGAYIGNYAFPNYSGKLTINGSLSGVGQSAFNGCKLLTTISVTSGSIGNEAFRACTNLNTVTFGEDVTSIGESAFNTCSSLKEITIHNSVTSIGEYAFAACAGLESVSVTSGSIGNDAFADCTNLSTVILQDETTGNGVASIGDYAFRDCNVLRTIKIPGTVKSMGKYLFLRTYLNDVTIEDGAYIGDYTFQNYSGKLTINGSMSGVGEFAFAECTGLISVSVTSSSIGQYAFKGCTNLSTVTFANTVNSIGQYAFANCIGLTSVSVPSGGIGNHAFAECTGLTSVSVTSGGIGNDAFAGCTNLSIVTFGEDVTSIEGYAFGSCTNLKDMIVKWTKAEKIPSIASNVFSKINLAGVTLHVPTYTTILYNAKDVWKDFNIYEDINFIITKTDDTTIEQKLLDNGSVTIDESEDDIKSLVVSEDATNVSVTYIRNFVNANKWQGWYVPFDVPLADMAKAGFDVAKIYGILLDNSGNTVLAFLKMEAGTVKANTPYVVRPNTSGKATITTTSKLHPTVAAKFAINSAEDTYTIGGIYEQTTTPGNWYAINKDGQFQKMNTDVSLRPFRIWMTIDPRIDNPYEPSVSANAKMDIVVIGDGEPTGIEGLTPTLSEGKGVIYNLQGQKVTSIQRGHVYIKNGKKYVQN